MPSLPEVMSIFPVSIYTKPLFDFSVFVDRIPSPPADTVIAASLIFTQSLPSSAQPVLLTVRFSPHIIRSSFETAHLQLPVILSVPSPFKVRSVLLNIAPSTFVSLKSPVYDVPSDRVFTVPSQAVINTLSAFSI